MRFGYDGEGVRLWKREYLPRPLGVVVRLTLYAGYGFVEGFVEELVPHEAGEMVVPGDVCGKVEGVTDLGFTGQRQEIGFGLYDYKARYFSPALGRFISPDPIVPDYTNPQALNRYAYVYNNPLKFTDPSGHCGTAAVGGGTGSFATPLHTFCEGFGGGGGAAAAIRAVATLPIIVKTIENLDELSKGGVGNPYPVGGGVSIPSDGPSSPPLLLSIPPHSAPMNADFPELHADPEPLDSGLTIEDTFLTASDNRYFDTRGEAFNGIKDRAGIPRTQQPIDQWTVGNSVLRTRSQSYRFSRDRTTHGRYYLYDMGQQGMVLIAEHTNDSGAPYPHFHAGGVPKGAGRDYDFREKRYKQLLDKHHYYYKE